MKEQDIKDVPTLVKKLGEQDIEQIREYIGKLSDKENEKKSHTFYLSNKNYDKLVTMAKECGTTPSKLLNEIIDLIPTEYNKRLS